MQSDSPFQGSCHTISGTHLQEGERTPLLPTEHSKSSAAAIYLHLEKNPALGGLAAKSWISSPASRLRAAVFQRLCHLQLEWGPQHAPSPRQDDDNKRKPAEKGQEKSNAGHWPLGCSCFTPLLAVNYKSALLALVYQQFTLQKLIKYPKG